MLIVSKRRCGPPNRRHRKRLTYQGKWPMESVAYLWRRPVWRRRLHHVHGRPRVPGPAGLAEGFTLYMVKAVMDRRSSEVVDLAKTGLWR